MSERIEPPNLHKRPQTTLLSYTELAHKVKIWANTLFETDTTYQMQECFLLSWRNELWLGLAL